MRESALYAQVSRNVIPHDTPTTGGRLDNGGQFKTYFRYLIYVATLYIAFGRYVCGFVLDPTTEEPKLIPFHERLFEILG